MPIWIWFYIALSATALKGPPALWDPVDPTARSKRGDPIPGEYHLQSSAPWVAVARPDVRGHESCRYTVLAFVTAGVRTRLVLDGVEQNVDSAWTSDVVLEPGKTFTHVADWLAPIGGVLLAERTVSVRCEANTGPSRDRNLYTEHGLRGYEQPGCPVCP